MVLAPFRPNRRDYMKGRGQVRKELKGSEERVKTKHVRLQVKELRWLTVWTKR